MDAQLVVWSEASKKDHFRFGVNKNRMVVIPPGLGKPPRFNKKNNGDSLNILFVGTWFKRKGGFILLKAFEKLVKKYPRISLTLITQLPKGVKLPKNTIQYNYLPRKQILQEIFPKADVFVLVPAKAEGFGLTPLEAFSFSMPVIVSSVYALPEIVDNNKNGFVVRVGSVTALETALETFIKNPTLRKKMGKEGYKKFLERFWIKKTNKTLLKAYQDAIKAKQ